MMNTFLINNSLKTVLGKIYILECFTSTILRIVFRYQRWWWERTRIIFSDIRLNNIWNLTVSLGVFWLAVHIYWKWINPSGMINIRDSADSRADGSCSNCDIIAPSSICQNNSYELWKLICSVMNAIVHNYTCIWFSFTPYKTTPQGHNSLSQPLQHDQCTDGVSRKKVGQD